MPRWKIPGWSERFRIAVAIRPGGGPAPHTPRDIFGPKKLGLGLVFLAECALAQVVEADYDRVAAELGGVFDFEAFEVLPEPGAAIEGVISAPGLRIGERFAGQRVARGQPQDRVTPPAPAGLAVRPGAPGRNHAVAHHAGFGSNALFPLGPAGFGRIEGRGEGATAIRFARPRQVAGFRVHADYADPLGTRPAPGTLRLRVFGPGGRTLGTVEVALRPGVMSLGFRSIGAPIAGLLIETHDPGGIALDDILFAEVEVIG